MFIENIYALFLLNEGERENEPKQKHTRAHLETHTHAIFSIERHGIMGI